MKQKQPAFLFYPGDWLKDPALSSCSLSARAVWIDLLCAMHESDRSGVITGSLEQLARVSRCSAVEFAQAIADFKHHRTADVTERAGIVTIINRRMNREHNEREGNRLRKSKSRLKPPSHQCHNPSSSSPSFSEDEGKPTNPREPTLGPKLAEVQAWAATIGCPPAEAERFWNHFEASGWIDKHGHAIVNARAKLANWATDARSRPLEAAHKAQGGPQRPPQGVSAGAELVLRQKELERVEARIKWLREQGNGAFNELDAKTKAELTTMKKRRVELIGLLGLAV